MAKSKTKILVIDNGAYTYVATALARHFETVRYYSRWESGFPFLAAKVIGDGFPGVERVDSVDDWEEDTDIFIITDVYFAPLANRLRRQGKKVWGSGDLEYVERDRELFIEELEKAGLPVPPGEVIHSFDKLVKFLKGKKDMYVKLSEYRGNAETFHWIDDAYTQYFVDDIKLKVGPYVSDPDMTFIVQTPIQAKLEYGIDNDMVDGVLSDFTFFGFEDKGVSYFLKMDKMKNLPKGLQEVNDKFEKIAKKYGYTGPYSNEVRVEDETNVNYFIDITCRLGMPPSASMFHMGENWAEKIEAAVNGKTIPLKPKAKYCVEYLVVSHYKDGWNPIKFDEKYKDNIYPCYCCMYDGVMTRVPNKFLYSPSDMICIVVAEGDTLEAAIELGTEILSTVEAIEMDCHNDLAVSAPKIIENLKSVTGYSF